MVRDLSVGYEEGGCGMDTGHVPSTAGPAPWPGTWSRRRKRLVHA